MLVPAIKVISAELSQRCSSTLTTLLWLLLDLPRQPVGAGSVDDRIVPVTNCRASGPSTAVPTSGDGVDTAVEWGRAGGWAGSGRELSRASGDGHGQSHGGRAAWLGTLPDTSRNLCRRRRHRERPAPGLN
jgi:hypothetical protein